MKESPFQNAVGEALRFHPLNWNGVPSIGDAFHTERSDLDRHRPDALLLKPQRAFTNFNRAPDDDGIANNLANIALDAHLIVDHVHRALV